jgi:formylglycine-generating enzyme required for sulfatase activity
LKAATNKNKASYSIAQELTGMDETERAILRELLRGKHEILCDLITHSLLFASSESPIWLEIIGLIQGDGELLNEIHNRLQNDTDALPVKKGDFESYQKRITPLQLLYQQLTINDRLLIKTITVKEFVMYLLKAAINKDGEISNSAVQMLKNMDESERSTLKKVLCGKDEVLQDLILHFLLSAPLQSSLWLELAGLIRGDSELLNAIRSRLQEEVDAQPFTKGDFESLQKRMIPLNILAHIEHGYSVKFWDPLYGEPEWVDIPAGVFWLGEKDDLHQVHLPEYKISRVPVTNAQYALYIYDTKAKPPEHWDDGKIPQELETRPVVNISWYEALAYCRWLGEKIQKTVTLPSEAEWEKAARGDKDKRIYPWGDDWRSLHCNSSELGLKVTTPVGFFLNGASPHAVLDMSGNIWEWTRSIYKEYPYKPDNEMECMDKNAQHVIRGGSFNNEAGIVVCGFRGWEYPDSANMDTGFRVVLAFSV